MKNNKFNWRYAVGEILIVSVGILIAFFINSWSLNLRKASSSEEYRKSLVVDLEQNLASLNNIIKLQEEKVAALNYVVNSIEKGSYIPDSIGAILYKQRKSPTFFPVKGTFKALVSQGEIELFTTNIKRELFNLYDTIYERTVYNGNLYDNIYIEVYDVEIQEIIDLRTKKINDLEKLTSKEFKKNLLVIVDEAESYLKLIKKTKTESLKVLELIKRD